MTDAGWHLHMQLIRMAKGAIRAWENWLKVTSGSIEQPPPSDQPRGRDGGPQRG